MPWPIGTRKTPTIEEIFKIDEAREAAYQKLETCLARYYPNAASTEISHELGGEIIRGRRVTLDAFRIEGWLVAYGCAWANAEAAVLLKYADPQELHLVFSDNGCLSLERVQSAVKEAAIRLASNKEIFLDDFARDSFKSRLKEALLEQSGLYLQPLDAISNGAKSDSRAQTDALATSVEVDAGEEKERPRSSKRGPKPDFERARIIKELVDAQPSDGHWKDPARLKNLCLQLDSAELKTPKSWKKEGLLGWVDALEFRRDLVVKAIERELQKLRANSGQTPG